MFPMRGDHGTGCVPGFSFPAPICVLQDSVKTYVTSSGPQNNMLELDEILELFFFLACVRQVSCCLIPQI